ncbi:unnamed protein product [Amaranthus hypochondriacus]
MGCGVSKSEPVQESGLRPMLRRRLEEFTARRHGGLSKKQLLSADAILISRDSEGEDDDHHDHHDDHDGIPNNQQIVIPTLNDDESFQFTQQSPPTPQIIIPTIENNVNFDHDDHHDDYSDHDKVNDDNHDVKEEENKDEVKIIKVQEMEILSKDLSLLQEEEELNSEEVENMNVCPGSPSFRVYCIHSVDDELEEIAGHSEESKEDDKECIGQESNEVVAEKKVGEIKKHKKGMKKLKLIAIPKGAGKSIKHNMQNLYNFPCSCTNNHSHQLISEAAA